MLHMPLSLIYVRFFFSHRRRHTRSLCDWSSDVCSSDLEDNLGWTFWPQRVSLRPKGPAQIDRRGGSGGRKLMSGFSIRYPYFIIVICLVIAIEIGRASCRERV